MSVISPGYISTALSLNAVTGDGTKYGVTDETTKSGMDPAYAAKGASWPSLTASQDFILAEGKRVCRYSGQGAVPQLLAKLLGKRSK